MRKRICYIHVGPHKSGTTSIQWFLQENADVTEEFTPNDFEMRRPDWLVVRRLRRAISKLKDFAHQMLLDPALAVEAPWNDMALRSRLVSKE
jgi:hypothetical protein